MLPAEIENDNLENQMVDLMYFCSNNPIPRAPFDAGFLPRGSGPIKILSSDSLLQYVGNIIKLLRNKFPEHDAFANLEEREQPEFWKRLRPQFSAALGQYHIKIGSDYQFGEITVRPLYSSNLFTAPYADSVEYVSAIDLKYICKELIRSADAAGAVNDGSLQHRAIILTTFLAAARGGEVKFVDTTSFMFHQRFGCLDIVWSEMKTLHKYAMPMFPHKDSYELDFYHAIGAYWCTEGGLIQTEQHQGFESFLFPYLHSVKNEHVSQKITNIIRNILPANCPEKLKNEFCARSLRKGPVTQMLIDPDLGIGDICGRSGHSTGTNLDSYSDKRNIVLGMRAGKLLADWSNVNDPVKVPRLECLFGDESTEASPRCVATFVEKLFANSLDSFKPGQPLHIVLRTCAASLIMHHLKLTEDLPSNPISATLYSAAREAKLSDNTRPGIAPEVILDGWSRIILDDFRSRNPEIAPVSSDSRMLAESINRQSTLLNNMHQKLKEMDERQSVKDALCTAQARQISDLMNRLASVESENMMLRAQVTEAKANMAAAKSAVAAAKQAFNSPERVNTMRVQEEASSNGDGMAMEWNITTAERPAAAAAQAVAVAPPVAATVAAMATAPVAAESESTTATTAVSAPVVPPLQLRWNFDADRINRNNNSAKGDTIQNMLIYLYKNGGMKRVNNWNHVTLTGPYNQNNRSYAKNTLELCHLVVTEEERRRFNAEGGFATDESLARVSYDIQRRAFAQMAAFEADNMPTDDNSNSNKKKGTKKATYVAVGQRVGKYKKSRGLVNLPPLNNS